MTQPILSVRGLNKSFHIHAIDRHVQSLYDIDFDVMAGEHLALAGSSGAGKSSLLRCLVRTYLPDTGTVVFHKPVGGPLDKLGDREAAGSTPFPEPVEGCRVESIDLTALSDRRMAQLRGRDFGYVSQFLQAPPRTGPLELVARSARRRGLDDDAAREAAAIALRSLNIDEVLWDMDCSVLSGGERQRVNLAAGTVSPPALLLLDEPVSALDPANREHALQLIEGLRAQNVSVVAVYHDMRIIQRVASRVLVLEGGRIVANGTPADVFAQRIHALEEVVA